MINIWIIGPAILLYLWAIVGVLASIICGGSVLNSHRKTLYWGGPLLFVVNLFFDLIDFFLDHIAVYILKAAKWLLVEPCIALYKWYRWHFKKD